MLTSSPWHGNVFVVAGCVSRYLAAQTIAHADWRASLPVLAPLSLPLKLRETGEEWLPNLPQVGARPCLISDRIDNRTVSTFNQSTRWSGKIFLTIVSCLTRLCMPPLSRLYTLLSSSSFRWSSSKLCRLFDHFFVAFVCLCYHQLWILGYICQYPRKSPSFSKHNVGRLMARFDISPPNVRIIIAKHFGIKNKEYT